MAAERRKDTGRLWAARTASAACALTPNARDPAASPGWPSAAAVGGRGRWLVQPQLQPADSAPATAAPARDFPRTGAQNRGSGGKCGPSRAGVPDHFRQAPARHRGRPRPAHLPGMPAPPWMPRRSACAYCPRPPRRLWMCVRATVRCASSTRSTLIPTRSRPRRATGPSLWSRCVPHGRRRGGHGRCGVLETVLTVDSWPSAEVGGGSSPAGAAIGRTHAAAAAAASRVQQRALQLGAHRGGAPSDRDDLG